LIITAAHMQVVAL
nr:immunoglobulin light chain junction region [Homo sapiens]